MSRFLLRRLASSLLLLYLVLTFTFFFIHLAPGEPSILFMDPRISAAKRLEIQQDYGLDLPIVQQYWHWMSSVLQGNWGLSFTGGRPALEVILEKLPNTGLLVLAVCLVEYGSGILLGIAAAQRAGRPLDRWIRSTSMILYAVPVFWLALMGIEFLAVQWQVFPIGQMTSYDTASLPPTRRLLDLLHHLALPALVLGLSRSGAVIRYVRNGLLEVQELDYIRTAYAKGLSTRRVLWVHALRNALLPLVQRLGTSLPMLLGGSLIIETIFSWPGIGFQVYLSILQRDYPIILASTAVSGITVVLGNLLADVTLAWLDPRVRHAS